MKIIIDDKIPFIRGAFEPYAEVVYLPGKETTAEAVKDADALITRTRTKCDANTLAGSKVKYIASATIGYDHIDTAYCESVGIGWTNAPGCNSSSVAQYIASTLLTLAVKRKLDLESMTLGVVGVGHVGSKVAKVGEALGMKVLLNDPPRAREEGPDGFVELSTVLEQADIITFHVPLYRDGQDKTFHLADADLLDRMKLSAILINSSRGEVVDGDALKAALQNESIAGAVLDVWEDEPDLDLELLELVDLATPHIAGYSADGKVNGTTMSVHAVASQLGIEELQDWQADNVPVPESTTIILEPGLSKLQQLYAAVTATYDIRRDDVLLRTSPQTFEAQRGEYPLRREAGVFSIEGAGDTVVPALKLLGFGKVNE